VLAPWIGSALFAQGGAPGATAATAGDLRPFRSRSNTFRIDLPADWRQLAPGEVADLQRKVPDLPLDVGRNEPALFYAVGPIDRWLAGDFDGSYLYVVEQDNEWHLGGDLQPMLQAMWDRKGASDGNRYEILAVERTEAGVGHDPVVTCRRRITPPTGRAQCSLDVHAPTGGIELTLCFTCWDDDFQRQLPRFRAMLGTLELARKARGSTGLADRLWTPVIAGAIVGTLLLLLYRHTRRPVV
jgi:hypothetical protein